MEKEFRRIVVAIDGSESARRAARKAIALAKSVGTDVLAVYVIDSSSSFIPRTVMSVSLQEFLEKQGTTHLAEVRQMAKDAGVNMKTKLLKGIPYTEIVDICGKNDLLVIGNKGKTAADRILMGTVSEKVVRYAKCPVMVVK